MQHLSYTCDPVIIQEDHRPERVAMFPAGAIPPPTTQEIPVPTITHHKSGKDPRRVANV